MIRHIAKNNINILDIEELNKIRECKYRFILDKDNPTVHANYCIAAKDL